MGKIVIETYIAAPISRCFDLARNTELHAESATGSKEVVIAGSRMLELNDAVTFRGRHFGITQEVTAQIVAYDRPHYFQDVQIKGIFRSFTHDHSFRDAPGGTIMTDVFTFECPFGRFLADFFVGKHLRRFLVERNQTLKRVAETDEFKRFV